MMSCAKEHDVVCRDEVHGLCDALVSREKKRGWAVERLLRGCDDWAADVVEGLCRATSPRRLEESCAIPLSKLLDRLLECRLDSAHREIVVTWSLSCSTARVIEKTDDTYEFAAAMKRVRSAIDALPRSSSSRARLRRDAIVHCLTVATQVSKDPSKARWARAPVEACVVAASKRKGLFGDQLDSLAALVRQKDWKNSGAAAHPRLGAPRKPETAHHPLRNVRRKI